jgi:hypothetical protein
MSSATSTPTDDAAAAADDPDASIIICADVGAEVADVASESSDVFVA